jgi:hypothetical protein
LQIQKSRQEYIGYLLKEKESRIKKKIPGS